MRTRTVLEPGFVRELIDKAKRDRITMGAAAVAFYSMVALFPAAILVLTLLPYLPIPHLEQAVMDLVRQALPGDSADVVVGTVKRVLTTRRAGLLSLGFVFTLFSASSGMHAVMRQLNVTYEVAETRSFLRRRTTALLLMLVSVLLVLGSLALAVFGGEIQSWMGDTLGWSQALLVFFAALRWLFIAAALMLALAVVYHFGPNRRRRFAYATAGTIVGTSSLALAVIGFNVYVSLLGSYDKVYGTLGAVIVLLLWLFVTGLGMLLGAEVDAIARRGEPVTGTTEPRRGRPFLRPKAVLQ